MANTAPSPAALLTALLLTTLDEETHGLVNAPDSTRTPVLEMSERAAGFSKCGCEPFEWAPGRLHSCGMAADVGVSIVAAVVVPVAGFWQEPAVVLAPFRPAATTLQAPEGRPRVQEDRRKPSPARRPT